MTPIVTSARAVTRVAAASFWKRVTRRPFYARGPEARWAERRAGPCARRRRLRDSAVHCRHATTSTRREPPWRAAARRRLRRLRARASRQPAVGRASSPCRRGGLSDLPDAGCRRPRRLGRAATTPSLTPVLVSNSSSAARPAILFLYLDSEPAATRARRTGPPRSRSTTWARTRPRPSPRWTASSSGRSRTSAACTSRTSTCPRPGQWGAEFTTEAPGSPAETTRLHVRGPRRLAVGRGRRAAPASKTPTLERRRRRASAKISTDQEPDPAFYQTSVADALAAHKPFVLVFATPQVLRHAQCGPTLDRFKPVAAAQPGRDVHQRRAVPARRRRRLAGQLILDAGRERQPPGGPDHERVGPALRAVDLRGGRRRHRPRLVRGRDLGPGARPPSWRRSAPP